MPFHKRQIKVFRWFVSLLLLLLFAYLSENKKSVEPPSSQVPVLYSNACQDDLEELFVKSVQEAKKSILLITYSMSDMKLIQALNHQANQGVEINVVYDKSTPPGGFKKLSKKIVAQGIKFSGLMHKKILVLDNEKILLGSANMTSESLRMHDNLVVGLINSHLAQTIENQEPYILTTCSEQQAEYWSFPEMGKEGLQRVLELIHGAQYSLRIAMFTWTHPQLTQAVIRAHQRGVKVEIIMDHGQTNGVCQATYQILMNAGIDVRVSSGLGLLHHKFAWIDETTLINGSANWTAAAFTRNKDCLLILYTLSEVQNKKMRTLWKKTKRASTKEEFHLAA